MNEQIKQLAIKAGDDWEHTVKEDREFLEKFAKLVVRECCDIFVELRTRPADLAVKDVKKHFGVEE
jgi:hypothetical protein